MREVVKKEVIKLLDAGIIYPVPHSEWVSPVYCGETLLEKCLSVTICS
jgi:hypothetical protein